MKPVQKFQLAKQNFLLGLIDAEALTAAAEEFVAVIDATKKRGRTPTVRELTWDALAAGWGAALRVQYPGRLLEALSKVGGDYDEDQKY